MKKNLLKVTFEDLHQDLLNGFKRLQVGKPRTDLNIHASDLYSFCPRRWAIAYQHKVSPRNVQFEGNYHPSRKMTFRAGEFYEELVREALQISKRLAGIFKCQCCEHTFFEQGPCPKCGKDTWEYSQLELVVPIANGIRVEGHIDMVYKHPKGGNVIVESKMMGVQPAHPQESYDSLNRPKTIHLYQVQTYLWLTAHGKYYLESKGKLNPLFAAIVYLCRLERFAPFKLYALEKDKQIQLEITRNVSAYKLFLENGAKELPPRVCTAKTNFLAHTYCPTFIREMCFKE